MVAFSDVGRRVLVGWTGSREAARALNDAIPLMRGAEIVSVLSLEKPSEGATIPTPPPDVVAHLNRTPTASPRTTSKVLDKVGTADVLRRRAAQMQADLLVMGGLEPSRPPAQSSQPHHALDLAIDGMPRAAVALRSRRIRSSDCKASCARQDGNLMDAGHQVTLTLQPSELPRFDALFQRGVRVLALCGRSVHQFLTDELGLAPEYVRDRVSTVFLDGDVLDDLEKAVLRAGSTLALSAAMPGVVGAALRRGGYYAAMRGSITRDSELASGAEFVTAVVTVKLFNLLLKEVGPTLLERGIVLDAREVQEALGAAASRAELPQGGDVLLRCKVAPSGQSAST